MTPDLLLKGGLLLDPETGATRRADVLIRDGRIARIAPDLDAAGVPVYDASGKMLSPGWMDMHVHLREPGFEHKETIETGCRAAAFGGFTAVACMPNTNPPIDTPEVVAFIRERAEATPVDVYPIACVSVGRNGAALTGAVLAGLDALAGAGAVAFSDDGSPVQSSALMRQALEAAARLDRPIINHMEDMTAGPKGHMNEGAVSRRLGIRPVPALSEEMMIARDLLLCELTGGPLHVAHLSTAKGAALVRLAKARGLPVTAEVCTHHVTLTDEAVAASGCDPNTKMHPPLRTAADVAALKEALRDGTLDALCTDHAPHAPEEKAAPFEEAPFGILGLETAWGLTGRELIAPGVLSVAEAVYKLTVAPRRILRLPVPRLAEGEAANLTVFDATTRWTFEERHIRSKSRNTPFVGWEMIGRAWAIYNKGQLVTNEG
ncbi:dihydroorotase [Rhodocaloribacter litoris]|uniref:dihydroorotase n=1 Tax=Rhodocaloribacter litoris TaxID=2558931 RepID=UPI00141E0E4C|nr:dihydroorotase [Rhodocaloribacter litoris]QXD14288.1 dihydroorotase [Rhodocaloribacter litoris]